MALKLPELGGRFYQVRDWETLKEGLVSEGVDCSGIIHCLSYVYIQGKVAKTTDDPNEIPEGCRWGGEVKKFTPHNRTKWYVPGDSTEFQESMFAEGVTWIGSGKHVLKTGPYFYIDEEGEMSWGSDKPHFDNSPLTLHTWKSRRKAHVHHEHMLEYAKDAAQSETPWEGWQTGRGGHWVDLRCHPYWEDGSQYRRKPEYQVGDELEGGEIVAITENAYVVLCDDKTEKLVRRN